MNLHTKRLISILAFPCLYASCSFNFELTSQRTALENQILGTYKELDDDLIVTNFDKAPNSDANKESKSSKTTAALLKANKNRLFNADDIDELKDNGILGESADGLIKMLPKERGGISDATPDQIKLAEVLVDEENQDRSVIWKSTIAQNPELSNKDLPKIQENFARDVYESSPKGRWFYQGQQWNPKQ